MTKCGLVLEGGGMRGLFTAGVLDYFIDRNITFPYIIGVSAGVCHGVSYLTQQRGRSRQINIDNVRDRRYVSFYNLLRTGSMFGMDFVFDEIPNKLYPFDFDTFNHSPAQFVSGVTDVETGKPVYIGSEHKEDINLIARASSSIPVFSPIVEYRGGKYLDGGTSDPIPFEKALSDGCEKVVVILTRDRGFSRKPEHFRSVYRRMYRHYPNMVRCLDDRHNVYNRERKAVFDLEEKGRAFVITPGHPVTIGRFERNKEKLDALYREGYAQAERLSEPLDRFLNQMSES